MAKTDFLNIIIDAIQYIDLLEKRIDSLNPKLNTLRGGISQGLNEILNSFETNSIEKTTSSMEGLIDSVLKLKQGLQELNPTSPIDVKSLTVSESLVNSVVNKLAIMRDSLNTIQKIRLNAEAIGLGEVYPFTERKLEEKYPRYFEISKEASIYGVYDELDKSLGLSGSLGLFSPIETAIHELGHHLAIFENSVDNLRNLSISEGLVLPTTTPDVISEKLTSAGLPPGIARDVAENQYKQMMGNFSEAFAQEFSNLILTGETVIPGFETVITSAVNNLGKETKEIFLNLINDIISGYSEQLQIDATKNFPKTGLELRATSLKQKMPIKTVAEHPWWLDELYVGGETTRLSSLESGNALEDLGNQAELSQQKIELLTETLRELIKEATRGGEGTEKGISKAIDDLLGGGELTARQRVGGGGYLSMAKEIRDEIQRTAQELRTEIENLNRLRAQLQERPAIERGGVEASQEAARKATEALAKERIPVTAEAVFQRKTAEGKPLISEENINRLQKAFGPLFEQINNLDYSLQKTATRIKFLQDGFVELDATLSLVGDKGAKASTTLRTLISPEGTFYPPTKDVPPTSVRESFERQFPKITEDPAKIAEIERISKSITDVYERLGVTLRDVNTSYSIVDDSTIRFTISMKDSSGAVQRFNAYLKDTGEILTDVAYKEQQVVFTEKNIINSLGEVRARRALALAEATEIQPATGDQEAKYFSAANLKKVYTQQPSGVSFLRFQAEDAEGVMKTLEITVDRFGRVLTRTNRRLLGFTESVIKNTQELLRWSVGVGLVYGTFFRFQELVRLAIDNEAKLADVTVTLGEKTRDLRDIFDDAAKVARQTGESINDVLETFVLSYRAVGGIEDPVQRAVAANQLLYDSTVLNKLSSLEASDSIDILSGALRQIQKPGEDAATVFGRGADLLDKWVAVSRRANVDLATLATAFSITAETAGNSGASVEELNAIIAVLAEKIGGLGGRETGNAVRALIGGLYQDQAAETLGQYGVAITDTSGKMRDFLDISRDIYELYSQGIISEDQLNKIAYAWGGGVRRGQQVVAFLSDYDRVLEIVGVQSGVAGNAQDALSKKLDITQTSVVQLRNSFQELAQSMGGEGGILDTANGLLRIFTFLVDTTATLTENLGRIAIPAALLGVGIAGFGWGTTGQGGEVGRNRWASANLNFASMISTIIEGIFTRLPGFNTPRGTTPEGLPIPTRAQNIGTSVFGGVAQYGLATLVGSYPAISRAGGGDWAGAGITFGGAVIGALATGGNPIGAIIGSSVAEAFLNGIERSKGEIEDIFVSPWKEAQDDQREKVQEDESIYVRKRREAEEQVFEVTGGETANAFSALLLNTLNKLTGGQLQGAGGGLIAPDQTARTAARLTLEEIKINFEQFGRGDRETYEAAVRALNAIEEAETYRTKEITPEKARITQAQALISGESGIYTGLLDEIAKEQQKALVDKSIAREIKPREFKTQLESLYGLDAAVSKLYTALYKDQDNFNRKTEEGEDKIREFANTLIRASTEDRDALNQLTTELFDIDRALENIGDAPDAIIEIGDKTYTAAQLTELWKQKLEELGLTYDNISKNLDIEEFEKLRLPSIVGLEDYTKTEFQLIQQKAKDLQDQRIEYYAEVIPEWNEDSERIFKDEADPIMVYLGEKFGYELVNGLRDSNLLSEAAKILEEAGTIAQKNIGYQFLTDITQAQFQSILPQYEAIKSSIVAAGGTVQEDELVTYFKDSNSPSLMKKDWKIVQFLLQRILEETEKGVEGLYNLPSDATFYVPSQALQLAYNAGLNAAGAGGGIGGGGGIVSPTTTDETKTISGFFQTEDPATRVRREYEGLDVQKSQLNTLQDIKSAYYSGFPKPAIEDTSREEAISSFLDRYTQPEEPTLLEQLLQIFKNLVPLFTLPSGDRVGAGIGLGLGVPENFRDVVPQTTVERPITTNLNLDMTSSVQLIVDGRTLATIVRQYLWEDLIRFDQTAGTATRTIIV